MANASREPEPRTMGYRTHVGSDGSRRQGSRTDVTDVELGAYAEEDDGATQLVEAPLAEPKWIVQVTPFDRRMMDTSSLVSGLREGALIQRGTLVWRGGMHDWLPIERVPDLPVSFAHTVAAQRGKRARELDVVMVSSALVVLALALTTFLLAVGGVFQ